LMIVPLTRPASEFHVTRSPTLNRFIIVDLRLRLQLGAPVASSLESPGCLRLLARSKSTSAGSIQDRSE
jgi:hypothetical protein